MSLDALHNEVAAACGTDFGCAVSFTLLDFVFREEIKRFAHSGFATGIPFPYRDLRASVELDPANVVIAVNAAKQHVEATAAFTIVIHLPGGPSDYLGRYLVRYKGATANLIEDPRLGGKVGLSLKDQGDYSYEAATRPPEFEDRLVEAGIVDADGNPDVAAYDRLEIGVFLLNGREFITGLLNLVPFPEFRESLREFRLGSPIKFGYLKTHLLLHSDKVDFPGGTCPRGGSTANELAVSADSRKTGSWVVRPADEGATAPAPIQRTTQAGQNDTSSDSPYDAALLLYYPERVLSDFSFDRLKPAVTFSDQGGALGVFWFYTLTASLRSVKITFQAVSPTEGRIVVAAPFELVGVAGAGIEIACVKYEVIGVRATGAVDPLEVRLAGGIDLGRKEIYFTSALEAATVKLRWVTSFGFPFDQIADLLLDHLVNNEVKRLIGREVDVFRRTIGDLQALRALRALYLRGIETNAQTKSFLLAINLDRG